MVCMSLSLLPRSSDSLGLFDCSPPMCRGPAWPRQAPFQRSLLHLPCLRRHAHESECWLGSRVLAGCTPKKRQRDELSSALWDANWRRVVYSFSDRGQVEFFLALTRKNEKAAQRGSFWAGYLRTSWKKTCRCRYLSEKSSRP